MSRSGSRERERQKRSGAKGVAESLGKFPLEVTSNGTNGVIFRRRQGYLGTLKLHNAGHQRQAFKMRSSCNAMLLMQPVKGVLAAGGSADVKLRYQPLLSLPARPHPVDDLHHYSISTIPAPERAPAHGVWAVHHGPPVGLKRLRCRFEHN